MDAVFSNTCAPTGVGAGMSTVPMAATIEDLLQHAAWARRLACTLVGDADADDIVQDSLLASLRAGPDAGASLLPWLRQVVRNRVVSQRRDRQRRRRRDEAAAAEPISATVEDPETSLGRMQAHRMLADLVAELPEPLRQTIILRYYDGLDSSAIGGAMGVSAGTARWRLKAAVEQLRQQLDRRHEGDRERWLRALVPLTGAPTPFASARGPQTTPGSSPGWLLPAIITSALLAGLGWLTVRIFFAGSSPHPPIALAKGDPAGANPRASRAAIKPGGSLAPPGSGPFTGPAPLDLPGCLAALAKVQQEAAAIAPAYRSAEDPKRLYASGVPHPAAQTLILPLVEKLFARPETAGFTFDLDCHTYACQLLVVVPDDGDAGLWMLPLQRDTRLNALTVGMAFFAGRPTHDPVSGKALIENSAYLRLATPGHDPAEAQPPAGDRAACALALPAAQRRLADMQGTIARQMSPFSRYGGGAANPKLTATISAIVDRALGADVRRFGLRIDCKADVCRLTTAEKGHKHEDAWRPRLERDPDFARHSEGTAVGPDGYLFRIGDPTRPQGRDFIRDLLRGFRAGPALAACAAAHPGVAGELELRLNLPNDAGPNALEADHGGALAGSPLGRCVKEAIARDVLPTQPPARVRGAMVFTTFKFPLAK